MDRLRGPPVRHRRRRPAPPAAQAGALGLHDPQQAAGGGAGGDLRLARAADRASSSAQEDLARVRPDLDGNAIMELLGIGPGPEVGQAWRFLKELRLERGPLDPDEAEAALRAWWPTRVLTRSATARIPRPSHSKPVDSRNGNSHVRRTIAGMPSLPPSALPGVRPPPRPACRRDREGPHPPGDRGRTVAGARPRGRRPPLRRTHPSREIPDGARLGRRRPGGCRTPARCTWWAPTSASRGRAPGRRRQRPTTLHAARRRAGARCRCPTAVISSPRASWSCTRRGVRWVTSSSPGCRRPAPPGLRSTCPSRRHGGQDVDHARRGRAPAGAGRRWRSWSAEARFLGPRRTPLAARCPRRRPRGMRSVGEGDLRRVVLMAGLPEPVWNAEIETALGQVLRRRLLGGPAARRRGRRCGLPPERPALGRGPPEAERRPGQRDPVCSASPCAAQDGARELCGGAPAGVAAGRSGEGRVFRRPATQRRRDGGEEVAGADDDAAPRYEHPRGRQQRRPRPAAATTKVTLNSVS